MRKYPVRDACQRFLSVTTSKSRTYRTYARYWARVWGSEDLRSITVERLREWRSAQTQWKDSTINVALSLLSNVFQQAIEDHHAKENPVRQLGWLKPDNQVNRFWTPEEVGEVLAACDEDLREIIVFAMHTGLRIGEVLALGWSDWQPGCKGEQGLLEVRRQKSKHRCIPLHHDAEDVLRKRRRERSERPFPGAYPDLYRRLKRVLRSVGIEDGAFHGTRHTFASWLAKENESVYKISRLLGHSSLQHTTRYARLQVDDLRSPLAALDRMKLKS